MSNELRPARPGAPPVDLGAAKVAAFTDLHLSADRPDEIVAFAASLDDLPADIAVVVIMGDLFDAFVGAEMWEAEPFPQLQDSMSRLAARGVRVILLRGNRDVLLESRHVASIPAEVADGLTVTPGEERVLITHGDEYCLRDRPYQRLRWWLRAPFVRGTARILPAAIRRWAARRLRSASQTAVSRKPLDTLALVEDAVVDALKRHSAQRALIGHLHVAEDRQLAQGRALRILPAWEPGTEAVILGPETMERLSG